MKHNCAQLAMICVGFATTAAALPPEAMEVLDRNEATMRSKLSAQYIVEAERYEFDAAGNRELFANITTICDHADGSFSREIGVDRGNEYPSLRYRMIRTDEQSLYAGPIFDDSELIANRLIPQVPGDNTGSHAIGNQLLDSCHSDILVGMSASSSGMTLRKQFGQWEEMGGTIEVVHESNLDGDIIVVSGLGTPDPARQIVAVFSADDEALLLGTFVYDSDGRPKTERRIEYAVLNGVQVPSVETTTEYRRDRDTGEREVSQYSVSRMASFTPTTGRTQQDIAKAFGLDSSETVIVNTTRTPNVSNP